LRESREGCLRESEHAGMNCSQVAMSLR
jgi:hypothetical protein